MADNGLLFGRKVRVTVATKVAEDYKSIAADVIEIEDLRVAFKVTKTRGKEPNTAEVTITNLSPTRRASLQVKGVKFILQAGYAGTGIAQLFVGDARTIDHVRDGANWHTVIKSGDGERAFRFARVKESFAPGSPLSDIVNRIASKMGLGLGNLKKQSASISGQYESGYTAFGPTSRELDKVLTAAGYDWSIQDNELLILKPEQVSGIQVPDLGPDSGLIGSLEFGAPEKKGGRPLLKGKCLLRGEMKPGGQVNVRSERHNGPIKLLKIEHTGDTEGGDWYTSFESMSI